MTSLPIGPGSAEIHANAILVLATVALLRQLILMTVLAASKAATKSNPVAKADAEGPWQHASGAPIV
jgi:hypothetical protein